MTDVQRREREFYDRQAVTVAPRGPDEYDRALLDALGPLEGLRVLELGCGRGDLTVELVGRGAEVAAVDVSPGMVAVARERVPEATFVAAPVEDTGLEAGSFDRVVGKWILHHADVPAAAREIARLLGPDGRAAFFENQDRNPLLRLARHALWRISRRATVGTPDERPLSQADFDELLEVFGRLELAYPSFYLFEALSRALGHRAHPPLRALDGMIWRRLPAARPYGYHVLLKM